MNNPEILIVTPAYGGDVKAGYVQSLFAVQKMLNEHGIKSDYMTSDMPDVALVRNFFASFMLERPNYTHLLFVDSDMTFSALTVGRLLIEAKPVIGCVYPKKQIDLNVVIELARKHKDNAAVLGLAHEFVVRYTTGQRKMDITDGLMRVAGLGMGLCLIARSAFSDLVATGKIQLNRDFGKDVLKGPVYGFFDQVISADGPLSEDFSFCERWTSLCGGDVWALVADRIGHVGQMEFSVSYIERLKQGQI